MDFWAQIKSEKYSNPFEFLNQLRQTTEPIGGGMEYCDNGEYVEYDVAIEAVKKAQQQMIDKLDCEYNPYKVTVKSILEMCARYDNTLTFDKYDFLDNIRVKCKDAIEYDNLHPQSHWKPTDEQMSCFKQAIDLFKMKVNDTIVQNYLESLYNDLKKL